LRSIGKSRLLLLLLLSVIANPLYALNIILTNDDSWHTNNIKMLKQQLTAAGHRVVMSAPCAQQSGKGGAFSLYRPIPVDNSQASNDDYCVGDTDSNKPHKDFVEGTPVLAAFYGIDVLAPRYWGKGPDLLISGPNEGHNVGVGSNHSGTLAAAMISVSRGVPTLAVSGDSRSRSNPADGLKIAGLVLKVIQQLEATREQGEPLLPRYHGLSMNLPRDLDNHKGFKITQVGYRLSHHNELKFYESAVDSPRFMEGATAALLASGRAENSDEALRIATERYRGQNGLYLEPGDYGDDNPDSEGSAVEAGYISISPIEGNIQASDAKKDYAARRLKSLWK